MTHTFNPDTNPFADDLLRLSVAPKSRFKPLERHFYARILAGKLYELEIESWVDHFRHWGATHIDSRDESPVLVEILFDSDSLEQSFWYWPRELPRNFKIIVLRVGVRGVVELFNGAWDSSTRQSIANAISGAEGSIPDSQENNGIPIRRDEDVRRDYLGNDMENGGGGNGDQRGGGDGGGAGGGGGGGGEDASGGTGAGGTGELLNHPVLFAVEREIFNAILDQT